MTTSLAGWHPQFDAMVPEQEQLAIQFCSEIVGLHGANGSPPDPVRLLEMADQLYQAERRHYEELLLGAAPSLAATICFAPAAPLSVTGQPEATGG